MNNLQENPDDYITIKWHINDVQKVRPDLDDEQARMVLWSVKQHHDANIGVNWDALERHADFIFGKEEDKT